MTSSRPNIVAKPEKRVAHHPAINDIRDLLTFRVAMIAAAGDRVGQRWLSSEFDLRIMEWRVLGVVCAVQPVRFFELARELIIDKGQLSRLVGNLARRGLIATEPDPDDLRTVRLRPTSEGVALHLRALTRALERNERVVAALEPGELETLFALLDKLQPYMAHRAEPDGDAAK
jgi:DNA-binding MarR family transcriptional regulator